MDIHVYSISMYHGCPFDYFQVNRFLGTEVAWILQPGLLIILNEKDRRP